MAIQISTAHNEYRLSGSLSHLDTGTGNAKIRIYDGTRPALGGTATNLLCEFTLADPCGVVATGALTLTLPADALILVNGTATWARVVNANGDLAWDCDCSDIAGNGDIKLAQTTLYAGGLAHMVSAVLT